MSREQVYNSIILKKSAYGEADEILTLYTQEKGKLRCLAKSVKFSKSKLQYSLQTGFLVKARLTKSVLPKLIGTEIVNSFLELRESLLAVKMAFFAFEAVLKGTADEQKNEHLFFILEEFLLFLDLFKSQDSLLNFGLAKFKIEFLNALGFLIHVPSQQNSGLVPIKFSNSLGGFSYKIIANDAVLVEQKTFYLYQNLTQMNFSQIKQAADLQNNFTENCAKLNILLSNFINFQLERELKSERLNI